LPVGRGDERALRSERRERKHADVAIDEEEERVRGPGHPVLLRRRAVEQVRRPRVDRRVVVEIAAARAVRRPREASPVGDQIGR
jgi:hypothetical protein